MLLFLSCWIIVGITATDDPQKRHYREINSSVCLRVKDSAPHLDGSWSFKNTFIIFNKEITPRYKERVIYNSTDLMLCINNLTEEDSGIYKVVITHLDYSSRTESHRLIVQETVPRPVMRMSVIHSNLSASLFCNITVNCSVHDESICAVCDKDGCRTTQRSFGDINITIFTGNGSIGCRGNNLVSKSVVSESMLAICFNESNPVLKQTVEPHTVGIIASVAAVWLFVLFILIACVVKKGFPAKCSHCQTQRSTARLIQSQPVEAQSHAVRRDSSFTSSGTEACYENVDATQPGQTSGPREELESRQSQKVDTVYCTVDGSEDAKEPGNIPEASTAQPVRPGGSKQPAQIETLYSVLQKPKNLKSQRHQWAEQETET